MGPRAVVSAVVSALLAGAAGGGCAAAGADEPATGAPVVSERSGRASSRAGPIGRGDDRAIASMLGRPAPPLPALRWLDGRARDDASLRGRVTLVRSFTDGCPYCAASMPTFERLWVDLRDRGLLVLGVFHPKPRRGPRDADRAARAVRAFGISFPVADDPGWALVDGWAGARPGWTSQTWLVDRRGIVRWAHPGGEIHEGGGPAHERCRRDARALADAIERSLAEGSVLRPAGGGTT